MFKVKKLNVCTEYCIRGVGEKIVKLLAKEGLKYKLKMCDSCYDIQITIENELDLDNTLMILRDPDFYGVTIQWL